MIQIFSDFVRSLEAVGGELPDDALDAMWPELRRRLRRELQRRGLWDRPPAYLGVAGHGSWTSPETADRRGFPKKALDALDELATDGYVELFVRRLPSFRRYLRRGDIERVVARSLRNFVQDRQKAQDPLGFRLYQRLHAALRRAIDGHRLHVLEGGPRIGNATVLGFDPDAEALPAHRDQLEPEVRRWNDDLLLDWVTAEAGEVNSLTSRLEAFVVGLHEAGSVVFRFKDVIDLLKHDLRARLAALWAGSDPADASKPETSEAAVHGQPLIDLMERDRLRELSECVEKGLRDLNMQERTRKKLRKLWHFLRAFALTAVDPESAEDRDDGALTTALQRDTLPSNRALSRILDIRHDRLPALFARLRMEVERCVRISQPSTLTDRPESDADNVEVTAGPPGTEPRVDETKDLRGELRRLTAEAFRRELPSPPQPARRPRAGDLYHFETCPEPGLEWLVLRLETATGQGLLVPADAMSWIGSSDVAVEDDTVAGPLSVRCGDGLWLDHDVLVGDRRSGAIGANDLERARDRHERLLGHNVEATAAEREMDGDPDYLDWRRTLAAAREALVQAHGGRRDEIPAKAAGAPAKVLRFERSETASLVRRSLPVAASIAAVLTSGYLMARFERQRHEEELAALQQSFEDQLAQANRPEVAVPWLVAPPEPERADLQRITVPAGARSIVMLAYAEPGDRVEIRDLDGETLWSASVGAVDTDKEVLVRWPAVLTPSGTYQVLIWRGDEPKIDFLLRVESP